MVFASFLPYLHLRAGAVDVEGADDDETCGGYEVAVGDRNLFYQILTQHVDVVPQLCADGDDGALV